jgi:hypothetical protein
MTIAESQRSIAASDGKPISVGHVPMYDEPRQVADMILATTSKAGGQLG